MQTMTRRFDVGIAGAMTSRPSLSSCLRVFGDIETNKGARDMTKQRHACRGRLAQRNQCCKGWDCSSHDDESPVKKRSQDEGARIPRSNIWPASSSTVQSFEASTATNPARTFTSYLRNCINDA